MVKNILLHIGFLIFFVSCTEEKKNPIQIKKSSYPVQIMVNDLIFKDSGTYFMITPLEEKVNIINAYFGCGKENYRFYDTIKRNIVDCSKNLLVENDTVKIYLEPSHLGKRKFEDITLLMKKGGDIFFLDTSFYYNVTIPNEKTRNN